MLKIRNVELSDLPAVVAIENLCFLKEEAATGEAFEKRIQQIPDSFFVAEEDGRIVGFVNGPVISQPFITDDLFTEIRQNSATGGHQCILRIAVEPTSKNRGIAAALLAHLENSARAKQRETITLTCKKQLISFYEKQGYTNEGASESEHGGVTWYNMVKRLII
ncbi:GNAT family N-acetyltransferase [Bacillus sp. FJAT-29814]|uniref:GNAT family N-acetyltransferase n=1 Tax=Bacillus sp. FJAT-29814 TaxID=1729688 RepID=UPI0008372154|nr:N-acetyltransferase [Bacillus sp. FJAT-29814]